VAPRHHTAAMLAAQSPGRQRHLCGAIGGFYRCTDAAGDGLPAGAVTLTGSSQGVGYLMQEGGADFGAGIQRHEMPRQADASRVVVTSAAAGAGVVEVNTPGMQTVRVQQSLCETDGMSGLHRPATSAGDWRWHPPR